MDGFLLFLLAGLIILHALPALLKKARRLASSVELWPFDRDITLAAVSRLHKGLGVFLLVSLLLAFILSLLPAS